MLADPVGPAIKLPAPPIPSLPSRHPVSPRRANLTALATARTPVAEMVGGEVPLSSLVRRPLSYYLGARSPSFRDHGDVRMPDAGA